MPKERPPTVVRYAQFEEQVIQDAWDALAELCKQRPSLRPGLDDVINQFADMLYRNGITQVPSSKLGY